MSLFATPCGSCGFMPQGCGQPLGPGGMQPPGMQPPGVQPPGVQPPGMQPPGMQPGVRPSGVQPPGMQPFMLPGGSLLSALEGDPVPKAPRSDGHRLGGVQPEPPSTAELAGPRAKEAEDTARIVADEIQDIAHMKRLSARGAVTLKRIHAEFCSVWKELVQIENQCGIKCRSGKEIETAILLPQLPEGDALTVQPLLINVEGFADRRLNLTFRRNWQEDVGGHPTYWSDDHAVLIFFSQAGSGRWQATFTSEFDGHDMLEEIRDTPADEHPRSLAYQVNGSLWSEYNFSTGVWQETHIDFIKPAEPDYLELTGFTDPQLDGVYQRRAEQVAGMSTYWSREGTFFLYVEKDRGRWQLSPRWQMDESSGHKMVDLLSRARRGDSPGLGMEVCGSEWQEYDCVMNMWKDVRVQFVEKAKPPQPKAEEEMPWSEMPPEKMPANPDADAPAPMVSQSQPLDALSDKPQAPLPGAASEAMADMITQCMHGHDLTVFTSQARTACTVCMNPIREHVPFHACQQCAYFVCESCRKGTSANSSGGVKAKTPSKRRRHEDAKWEQDWEREQASRNGNEHEALLARLPPERTVPAFDENADGTPADWNRRRSPPWFWGRKTQNCFPTVIGAKADIRKFMRFLATRPSREGRPLAALVGTPEPVGDSWFRCPWVNFSEASLHKESKGPWGNGTADWQRAWHGCKLEALYAIMYHGRLLASCNADRQNAHGNDTPGVYCHRDAIKDEALNCAPFVPLCRDGVFWSVMWEVQVDRSDRISFRQSEAKQWVQHERSCVLTALWVCGRTREEMEEGHEVLEAWDPLLEANPRTERYTQGQATELDRRVEAEYKVDNSVLQAHTKGMRFRKSKLNLDMQPDQPIIPWGKTVRGIDEGDGWLRVGEFFLPMKIEGHRVLFLVQQKRELTEEECIAKARMRFEGTSRLQESCTGVAQHFGLSKEVQLLMRIMEPKVLAELLQDPVLKQKLEEQKDEEKREEIMCWLVSNLDKEAPKLLRYADGLLQEAFVVEAPGEFVVEAPETGMVVTDFGHDQVPVLLDDL